MTEHKRTFAYIGNWNNRYKTRPESGFGICEYDTPGGELKLIKNVYDEVIVGATCLDARRNVLYCSHEYNTLPGNFLGGGGFVYAFAIDPASGDLRELNHQPSYGTFPSHVAVDAGGKYLIVTHHTDRIAITKVKKDESGKFRIALEYDDACTVLFRLNDDGSIGEPCDVYKHAGDGGPLPRQTHPQVHSVMMSPSGKLFAVCDKGNDRIYLFRINRETEKLEVCGDQGYQSISGGSPRYSVFHPTLPYLFVNYETRTVVCSFRYDEDGGLAPICTADSLPEGSDDFPKNQQSDIRIHPGGRHLYTLTRGVDTASVFEIDESTGGLARIQTVKLDCAGPRGCAISADGRYMHIAALTSGDVVTWAIGNDGTLSSTGRKFAQRHPGNVTFFPA